MFDSVMSINEVAYQYAESGWPVFPCKQDKRPYTTNGYKDATRDIDVIKQWWSKWPNALIGLPTGKDTGLVVIDIDVKNDQPGLESAGALKGKYGRSDTRKARTPSGGYHIYFSYPKDVEIGCRTAFMPGIDIRANGGYVIAPPSQINGKAYEWLDATTEIEPLPEGLRDELLKTPRRAISTGVEGKIIEGSRNDHLASFAGSMRRPGMTRESIEAALLIENEQRCDPPLPETEVRRIAASVGSYTPSAPVSGSSAEQPGAVVIQLSDVKPVPISWLWPDRIALGKVTLIAGDPGLGKSLVALTMAAHITKGKSWPVDNSECPTGSVVLLNAEDDAGDTIRPRLDAVDADVSKISLIEAVKEIGEAGATQRGFSLKRDIDHLSTVLERQQDCRLVVIDPITAYLDGTDSHRNSDVREVLSPLAQLASKHKAAIVCVTHLNKNAGGGAMYRSSGSLAFVAAARAAFIVAKDSENPQRRLMVPAKNNLGQDTYGIAYVIIEMDNGAPAVCWEPDRVTTSADEILGAENGEPRTIVDDAMDWLKSCLSDGPVESNTIKSDADSAGFSWATIKRAKLKLGIKAEKSGFTGGWVWLLPIETGQDAQDPPGPEIMSPFGEDEHLRKEVASDSGKVPDDLAEHAQGAQLVTLVNEHLRGDGQGSTPEDV